MTQEIDWVTERNKCSAAIVFHDLASEIEADVSKREEQLREQRLMHYGFQTERKRSAIVVHLRGNKLSGCVEISQYENEIRVKDTDGKLLYRATLTLDDLGQCRLKVKEKELERWQFRKLALEEFLFADH